MFGIERKLAKTAKRAGLLSGGLLLCTVGAAFFTVAVWCALLPFFGMAATALIVGAIYAGAGLICIGLGMGRDKQTRHTHPSDSARQPAKAPDVDTPPLMQAFMYGVQAGSQARPTRH